MQTIIYILLAFLMGVTTSVYLPMNSSVSKHIGSSITANITFFIVALLTSILIFILFGDFNTLPNLKAVPVYLYLTGFVSAFIVLGTTFLIPHLGSRTFFILLIAGQIVMATIVSNYGILSSPKDPITLRKVFGALLVVLGAIISTH
ncbi:MAG: DMT family transporter [Desulfobacterales bacterium]|nr:MAG: DMT family transporter [Desulfobacterales bacterium]